MRLNPKRDPGKPAYTVADCFVSENCLGGLRKPCCRLAATRSSSGREQEPQPDVSGDQSVYRFEAPAGESFCKAVLLRVSVAPNFGAFAPELKFSASKKAILATVRLPAGDGAPKYAWFDGFLILLSVKDVAFAESSCSLKEVAQEVACKGKCERDQILNPPCSSYSRRTPSPAGPNAMGYIEWRRKQKFAPD